MQTAMLKIRRVASRVILTTVLMAVNVPAYADRWNYLNGIHGRGYVICDAILKRLSSQRWTRESVLKQQGWVVGSVVLSYPGWRDPPWQDLDPNEHRDLIKELLKYNSLGADVYFGRKQPIHAPAYQATFDQSIEQALRQVNGLRVWRTHLISWLDDKPAPAGDQTVVNVIFSVGDDESANLEKPQLKGRTIRNPGMAFLVTDDLRAPDPRVSEGDHRRIVTTLLFDGKPHFLTVLATGWNVGIYRDFGSGPESFCELVFENAE